ncbi:hypothetical protein SeMB42_g08011, partial [Synchytrium endobioticum]
MIVTSTPTPKKEHNGASRQTREPVIENAVKNLDNRRKVIVRWRMPHLVHFPDMLVVHPAPKSLLWGMIATIVVEAFLKSEIDTIDPLLSPFDPKTMERSQILLTRSYLACVFEESKCLFAYINHRYHEGYQNELEIARTLAWDFLLFIRNQGMAYASRIPKSGADFRGFILPDDKAPNRLVHQRFSELSHKTALSSKRPCSDCVERFMKQLKEQMDKLLSELTARASIKVGFLEMAEKLHSYFKERNAHGNVESFPPVIDLTDDSDESTPNPDNNIEYVNLLENNRDQPIPEFVDFLGKEKGLKSLDLSLG